MRSLSKNARLLYVKELKMRLLTQADQCLSLVLFIVWSCKTLQNSKALVSASLKGAPYFEITLNGNKGEIYVDTYLKKSNECIKV